MKVMKVRRKSSYQMGTAKCTGARRTNRIHSWGSISKHVDDQCGKLIRCMRRNIINMRGRLRDQGGRGGGGSDIEVEDSSGKRSRRGSIKGIGEIGT